MLNKFLVKRFTELADAVKFAADTCKSKKEVFQGQRSRRKTLVFRHVRCQWTVSRMGNHAVLMEGDVDLPLIGATEHTSTRSATLGTLMKAWQESLYNKDPAPSPRKGTSTGKTPRTKEKGATIPISKSACRHSANIGVEQPCQPDTCDIFPCVRRNSVNIEYTATKEAYWLKEDGLARALNRDLCTPALCMF